MPTSADLKQQYKCRCGASHPQIARIGGTPVLECPAYEGDLDLFLGQFGVPYLVKGTGRWTRHVSTLVDRIEAAESLVQQLASDLESVEAIANDQAAALDRKTKK